MTDAEAIELLGFHACTDERIADLRWQSGFLGSLRPYTGLRERNFHEVMAIVSVLHRSLHRQNVPRQVVSSLWSLCHYGRAWGVDPLGNLRRNGLISDRDSDLLEVWITTISRAVLLAFEAPRATRLNSSEIDYDPPPEWERHWKRP
jgi:hypothetical protein